MDKKVAIQNGQTSLGIELGSTRIKAVLIDDDFEVIASGNYDWENRLENGIWTYDLSQAWEGLQKAFLSLRESVKVKYGIELKTLGSIGISAMMHGYLVFDKQGQQLAPFKTWRNSVPETTSELLTERFAFNIPQRWSIAHLYQAVLENQSHVKEIAYMTTLSGYIHWKLTGEKVLGIGDASGMFPIDMQTKDYNTSMMESFEGLLNEQNIHLKLKQILPRVLSAGENAGRLTEEGALLLDPTGNLSSGIVLCPPEGDAGTGMVATKSVAQRTGNISCGTSIFLMLVLEHNLKKVYPEIDIVMTPSGSPVAMVHANNCSSEINEWMKIFKELIELTGNSISQEELYSKVFTQALSADKDCGGLLSYGYLSGENITKVVDGVPLFARQATSEFNLANFMRMHLYSAFAAIRIGLDIIKDEKVEIDHLVGHGGIFKTPVVAQGILSAALQTPVAVLQNAGEGGAWGIALLSSFTKNKVTGETIEDFLDNKVFKEIQEQFVEPDKSDVDGFNHYLQRYQSALSIEQVASKYLTV